jgi:hypothetical protein
MMLSMKDGFLYMEVIQFVEVLWMVITRKFICLLDIVGKCSQTQRYQ